MTREIALSTGETTIVDDEMYPFLSRFRWFASPKGYVHRNIMVLGKRKTIQMHRVVACIVYGDFPEDHMVDHWDRNPLNNTSTNIRFATLGQNMSNRHGWGRTTKYKGVYGSKDGSKWRAIIQKDKVKYQLGYFPTAEEGARAYDQAARGLHGPYAILNFPEVLNETADAANVD